MIAQHYESKFILCTLGNIKYNETKQMKETSNFTYLIIMIILNIKAGYVDPMDQHTTRR